MKTHNGFILGYYKEILTLFDFFVTNILGPPESFGSNVLNNTFFDVLVCFCGSSQSLHCIHKVPSQFFHITRQFFFCRILESKTCTNVHPPALVVGLLDIAKNVLRSTRVYAVFVHREDFLSDVVCMDFLVTVILMKAQALEL